MNSHRNKKAIFCISYFINLQIKKKLASVLYIAITGTIVMDDILRDRNFYFYGIRFIYFNIKTTLQWYKETKKYINS